MTGVIVLSSLVVLMSSCTKECTCRIKYSDGDKYITSEFPENYNVKSCKELGQMMSGDGRTVSCK